MLHDQIACFCGVETEKAFKLRKDKMTQFEGFFYSIIF